VASEDVESAVQAASDQAVGVKALFQYANCDHPAMQELFDLAVQRKRAAGESKNEGGLSER
jgi:hypothetical protein